MREYHPPKTALLSALRAERAPLHVWACEVIDNSLDAAASLIEIAIEKDRLSISDDGHGIERGRENALITIGDHAQMPGTKLGRFGIGGTVTAIQQGDVFRVSSISKDGRITRTVNWRSIEREGTWEFPPSSWEPSLKATGTTITIDSLRKKPAKKDIDRVLEEVRKRYNPAIRAGKVIAVNDDPVEAIPDPEMTDIIQSSTIFAGGRSAKLRAGLLVNPSASKLHQVHLIVQFRVIKPDTSFGCNGYSGIRSMYAAVYLEGPWELTRFKDDIADDPFEDALEKWIEDELRPILEKCQSQTMTLKIKHMEDMLNEMVPAKLRVSRPEKKQNLGRVGEKLGKQAKPSAKHPDSSTGPIPKPNKSRGIKIEFANDLVGSHGYGRADFSGKAFVRIQLAVDCPMVKKWLDHRDEELAANSLYTLAVVIYTAELRLTRDQGELEPLGLEAWHLMECHIGLAQAAE